LSVSRLSGDYTFNAIRDALIQQTYLQIPYIRRRITTGFPTLTIVIFNLKMSVIMKTKNLLLLLFLVSVICENVQGQNFAWGRKFYQAQAAGSAGFGSVVVDVAADASGNSYVSGVYGQLSNSTATCGAGWTGYGESDGFLARLNTDGTVLWEYRIGGIKGDRLGALAVDAAGSVYATGTYACTAQFPSQGNNYTTPALATGASGGFIVKYSAAGNYQWSIAPSVSGTVELPGFLAPTTIASYSSYIYVAGRFRGTAIFGSYTLSSPNGGMFLARIENGGVTWAVKVDGEDLIPNGMEVDATGNVYLNGDIAIGLEDETPVSVNFGGSAGTVSGHIFVAKYNTAGSALWAKGVVAFGSSRDVGVDANGNVYVTGDYMGPLTFDGVSLNNDTNNENIYLFKFSPAGTALWGVDAGGPDQDYSYEVEVNAAGDSYISGKYQGAATIAGVALNAGSTVFHAYVAKYNTSGAGVWAREGSATSPYTYAGGLSLYDNDKLILGGSYNGTATFGSVTLTESAASQSSGFAVKVLPSTITTGTPSVMSICAGGLITVPYTTSGVFNTGNIFRVQLSNASGSFATPTTLVTLTSTAGSITARTPSTAVAGSNYRVRVVSSSPVINGSDNGSGINIRSFTLALVTDPEVDFPGGPISICASGSVTLNATTNSVNPVTYSWTPTGVLTPATGPQVTFQTAEAGNYTITLSGTDGVCTRTVSQEIDVFDGCFTAASETASISLYPNPAAEVLTVSLQAEGETALVQVLDLQGNVRKEARITETKAVAIGDLPQGLYLVRIKQGKNVYTERIRKN